MKQIEIVTVGFFKSNAREIINENDIETVISDAGNELLNKISEWISEGSGWVIKSVDKHEIDISKYKPLRGSSYLPLPEKNKKNKKATINIQNKNDNECFRSLRKRLRIRSVISVNYHYITVLCPFNLLIHFKCYNTV